jgi:hypothetical protein
MDEARSFEQGSGGDSCASTSHPSEAALGVCDSQLEATAMAITRDIFPLPATWETGCDPAFPEHTWRVVNVDVAGDLPSIAAKKNEWHRRIIEQLGEQAMNITLCVYPVNCDR